MDRGLTDTGERMVPQFHAGGLMHAEHLVRYIAAQRLVAGGTVLDAACGSGYGSSMLAQEASFVYALDRDPAAIAYARSHYVADNLEYIRGSVAQLPFDDARFDAVVTFETIEHVPDYDLFLREIRRVLKRDGLLILSTPNESEFMKGNRFHVHEFSRDELLRALGRDYAYIVEWSQLALKATALGAADVLAKSDNPDLELRSVNAGGLKAPLYFYLMCSDAPISQMPRPLLGLADVYSDRDRIALEENFAAARREIEAVHAELRLIKDSRSYRLARVAAAVWRRLPGSRHI